MSLDFFDGVLLFLVLRWLVLVYNLFGFPRLKPKRTVAMQPRVSLLVPARNEAENLRKTLPTLLQQGAAEILVLDDLSEDATAQVAYAIGVRYPGFRLLRGAPPPPGWKGKNWACWQLAMAAEGDVLVFTDADVLWQEGALGALLEGLQRREMVSVFPRQDVGWREGTVVSFVMNGLFSFLPHPLQEKLRVANGQVMAFWRESYFALGGHEAVRSEVLEDVALARRSRSYGLFLGVDIVRTRMYRGYGEALHGFAKNFLAVHRGSVLLLLGAAFYHVSLYTLPWLFGEWGLGVLGLLERVCVQLMLKSPVWTALLTPLAPLLLLPIYFRALLPDRQWKGRPV
jgi:glycosyltransferase involved in cell wall biosynthesis